MFLLVMLYNIEDIYIKLNKIPVHLLDCYIWVRLVDLHPIAVSPEYEGMNFLAKFIHLVNLGLFL